MTIYGDNTENNDDNKNNDDNNDVLLQAQHITSRICQAPPLLVRFVILSSIIAMHCYCYYCYCYCYHFGPFSYNIPSDLEVHNDVVVVYSEMVVVYNDVVVVYSEMVLV